MKQKDFFDVYEKTSLELQQLRKVYEEVVIMLKGQRTNPKQLSRGRSESVFSCTKNQNADKYEVQGTYNKESFEYNDIETSL